ncbi:MAG TPA: gephyrin-like molybdotransferase Glp [Chloroflexota bacterium]|nr:gephyrin-like molybdotransferase Glp [Chloroflexota bacterium]
MMRDAACHELPSPDVAWMRVRSRWAPPRVPDERVALLDALGRVTAQPVCSPLDSPPFDRAAMDGYAVRAGDLTPELSRPSLSVVGEVPMGRAAMQRVEAGEAIWVATGSMIPPGADAVVNVERTHTAPARVCIQGPVHPADHIVRRASAFCAGAPVLGAGHRLRPQDVAVLASLGLPEVTVVRQPRVAILVTGDELRLPEERLEPGQIYTSNGYALAAQVRLAGGVVALWPLIPDDLHAITAALDEALAQAELVLISGGSSVGTKDLTIQALEATTGAAVLVHGVAARPGRPTIVATVGDRLVIGIPGNPMAAMIAFLMFGHPALELLVRLCPQAAAGTHGGRRLVARLAEDLPSQPGRQEYICVRLEASAEGGVRAVPVRGSSSSLSSMLCSDGLVVVPPQADQFGMGKEVEVTVF